MIELTEKFWETTYQQQVGKMIGICYRYVANRQVAEDLAHEAFIIAINKSSSFTGKGKFEAWLRRIVVNVALQYLRDQKKQRYLNDWMLNTSAEMETPNDNTHENLTYEADFSKEELLAAINSLPEHHRLVFNLYVIDKFTHDQIGEELGISSGTSKSHLARARKKLRAILYQKATEKLSKHKLKRAILLLFIPFKLQFIDKLYQRNFFDFAIDPQTALPINSINFSNTSAPLIKPLILIPKAFLFVGIPVGIITVAVFFSYLGLLPQANNSIVKSDSTSFATTNRLTGNKENCNGSNVSDYKEIGLSELDTESEKENKFEIYDLKTATISSDSIILNENIKNDKKMKTLNHLGALLIATSSMALDSSAHSPNGKFEKLGEQGKSSIVVYNKNQKRSIDTTVKEVVEAKYDIISEFGVYRDNWALVKKGKLKGFIDTSGKEVIEVKYNEISMFGEYYENWALVEKGKLKGFIDTLGNEVVEVKYNEISEFNDYRENWALVEMNKLKGFIDTSGKEVVELKYDLISRLNDYHKCWALVTKGKAKGFIDLEGNEVVEVKYNDISYFGEYKKNWALVEKGNLKGFIDNSGKEIVEVKYNEISRFGDYQKTWALVEQDKLKGFIDTTGREVVELKYDLISSFNDYKKNWALVEKDNLKGFIDNTGQEVVETKYDEISYFGEYRKNWAVVQKGKLKGFIDDTGNEVVEVKYEEISEFGGNHKDWISVKKDGLWGAIDISGKEVSNP